MRLCCWTVDLNRIISGEAAPMSSLLLSAHREPVDPLAPVFAGSGSTCWLRSLPLAYKQDEGHISAATVGHLHELGGGRSSPNRRRF